MYMRLFSAPLISFPLLCCPFPPPLLCFRPVVPVEQANFCPSRAGLLAVTVKDRAQVYMWDMLSPQADKELCVVSLNEPSTSVAWERFGTVSGAASLMVVGSGGGGAGGAGWSSVDAPLSQRSLLWNRVLALGARTHSVEDTSIIPSLPVAMSAQGDLAYAYGVAGAISHISSTDGGRRGGRGVGLPVHCAWML